MKRLPLAALGGTFDHLHRGHKKLLQTAFRASDTVLVAITSDAFVAKSGKTGIQPLQQRVNGVKSFLVSKGLLGRASFYVLEDQYGPVVIDPAFDILVVSEGTAKGGHAANAVRAQKGMPPMKIKIVKFVLAEDGAPISSTRIRNKEIDENGKLLIRSR